MGAKAIVLKRHKPRSISTIRINNEIGIGVVLETFAHLLPVSRMYSFSVSRDVLALELTRRVRDQ